jgi:thiamine kinase-like enzyme
MTQTTDGIIIKSFLSKLGEVHLTNSELKFLQMNAVLCHNDVEPRNVLVRQLHSDRNVSEYKLVAIVDWEMAGFFPFAFESAWKDTVLGSSNLLYSWYSLYKQNTTRLVCQGSANEKLIEGVHIIVESKRSQTKRNVSDEFRRRWIERKKLKLGWGGWHRREVRDIPTGPFSKAEDNNLELEVLRAFDLV